MRLSLGFSPCPNDTFIFNALVNGIINPLGFSLQPCLHDVETLNRMAFDERLDISKLSFFAWLKVKNNYRLLSSGGALGYGCGPILISKKDLKLKDIHQCRVVLPGEWTTAHLLFRLWAPDAAQRTFTTYDKIFDVINSGEADCGVIIHESRFTFEQTGFQEVVDLGRWWEQETGLPIPLGCIAVHKRVPIQFFDQLDLLIQQSIHTAMENPDATLDYVKKYAQEMTPEVLKAHIDTFVNDFSLDIGFNGRQAIKTLEARAQQAGLTL